ncbi:MAG: glycosyltransferase [Candidatus Parvarchaeota archaeon]
MKSEGISDYNLIFLPLHRLIDSRWGGEFVMPLNLGLSLSSVGVKFTAFCGSIDTFSRLLLEEKGNTVIQLMQDDRYLLSNTRSMLRDIQFYWKLFKARSEVTDSNVIVHHAFPLGFQSGFNPAFISGIKNPKVVGPLLFHPNTDIQSEQNVSKNSGKGLFRYLYDKTLLESDLIIFDSTETRLQVCATNPDICDKEFLIMPWTGMEIKGKSLDSAKLYSGGDKLRAGIITHLRPRKRVDTVLRALKLADSSFIDLEIFGDGPSRNYLEKMCKDLALGNVHFRGAFPNYELNNVVDSLDLIFHLDIVPHLVNPTTNESLAHGIPVIFSEEMNVEKYIEYPYGWQVDADDPHVLAELIDHLSSHSIEVKQKSVNALIYAKQNISHEAVGSALSVAYSKLVEGRH